MFGIRYMIKFFVEVDSIIYNLSMSGAWNLGELVCEILLKCLGMWVQFNSIMYFVEGLSILLK